MAYLFFGYGVVSSRFSERDFETHHAIWGIAQCVMHHAARVSIAAVSLRFVKGT